MLKLDGTWYNETALNKAFMHDGRYYIEFESGARCEISEFQFRAIGNVAIAYIGGALYCNNKSMISAIENRINMQNGNALVLYSGDEIYRNQDWWHIGDMLFNPKHISKVWSSKNGKYFTVDNSMPIKMTDAEYAQHIHTVNITVTNGTWTGENEIFENGATFIVIKPDKDYVLPKDEDIVYNNCSINYNRETGEMIISNFSEGASVTIQCLYWLRPLQVGDDISDGKSIWVKKVDNIDEILKSYPNTTQTTIIETTSGPGLFVQHYSSAVQLNVLETRIYSDTSIDPPEIGDDRWNKNIKKDGELVIKSSSSLAGGLITNVIGTDLNGVVVFMKRD